MQVVPGITQWQMKEKVTANFAFKDLGNNHLVYRAFNY